MISGIDELREAIPEELREHIELADGYVAKIYRGRFDDPFAYETMLYAKLLGKEFYVLRERGYEPPEGLLDGAIIMEEIEFDGPVDESESYLEAESRLLDILGIDSNSAIQKIDVPAVH